MRKTQCLNSISSRNKSVNEHSDKFELMIVRLFSKQTYLIKDLETTCLRRGVQRVNRQTQTTIAELHLSFESSTQVQLRDKPACWRNYYYYQRLRLGEDFASREYTKPNADRRSEIVLASLIKKRTCPLENVSNYRDRRHVSQQWFLCNESMNALRLSLVIFTS